MEMKYWKTLPKGMWWAHLDLNQGPTGYEPVALTKLSYGPEGNVGFSILRFHSGQVLDFRL